METLDLPGSFGEWLKARRKALDLTQEEVAERAGCSIFALRKIESGERRPSKQLAGLIATALEVPEKDQETFIRVARGELNPERLHIPLPTGSSMILRAPQPVFQHLPLPPTPLLGRDVELAALERLFKDPGCRLLTLTGMGGIGKTRLAIEFASCRRGMFPGGVYYAPLASITVAEEIIPAMAEALGFSFSGPQDPKEQLIGSLLGQMNRSVLLVLDNFEHLLGPSAGAVNIVSELLQRLPHLRILATSRQRLNLHGEWMYELHGLPVPPTEHVGRLDEYSAAVLFVQNARRVKIDFEVDEEAETGLVRICQLLEGIPLAIELAAAWAGLLSCTEIADEIESNIDFLQTTMRDMPERHRSLRASFDHSWRYLSGEEQMALCCLAVFRGGFDRLAANRVTGAALPLLASLVSKSLVRRGDDGRYDLHEVIRQLALSHLEADPARLDRARDAHSEYYLQFAADRERSLRSASQQQAVRELLNEMDNLRAAWIWAIRRGQFSPLGASVRSLAWFFEVTGLVREGIEQFEPLVRSLRARSPNDEWQWVLGHTLTHQGMLYFRRGLFDQARAHMEASLSILRSVGRQELMTDVLVYLGIIHHLNGDMERSQTLMEEGVSCAQSAGDEWYLAYAIFNLGYLDSLAGKYEEGYRQMLEGVALWRKLGDPHSISLGLNHLAPTLVELGRYAEAETGLQESLRLCNESGNRWGMGTARRYLGMVKMAQGKLEEAKSLFCSSIDTFGEYFIGWDIAKSWICLAEAIFRSGDFVEARRVYLESLRLSKEADASPLLLDALTGLAQLHLQAGEYEQAFQIVQFVVNQPAGTQKTRGWADQIIQSSQKCLDDEQVQAMRKKLSDESLNEIVNALLAS
jgi:predicted ATPase/transcriptional regulator with XRE-family HTH domain